MIRFIALSAFVLWTGAAQAQTTCEGLLGMDFGVIPDAPTQLLSAEQRPTASHPQHGEVPAHCAITGYISSNIGIEMWLPLEDWNEKYLMQGCGGFCGSTQQIVRCRDALKRGYACITTDMGHKSTPIDAKWAYNNPQAEIDFYFRSTHATAQAGKAIAEAAYGKPPQRSYFRGCSTGGRQGLISAQRFPADFDGIIVGAPAGVSPYGGLHLIWSALANLDEDGAPILHPDQLPAIHDKAIAACDALDGQQDGIIDDPRQCQFDPASLQCSGDADCLSAEQVAVLTKIYDGPTGPDGERLSTFTPMVGSELNWRVYIGTDTQPAFYYTFGAEFFRYLAFAEDPGPTWRPEDFDFDVDVGRMGHIRMFNDAADPDMRNFARRGGKMIAYHGWADQSVLPNATIDYLEKVRGVMGHDETDDFFRLYMMPGVNHCITGKGPSYVDMLTALENWVEDGTAPGDLTAYKPKPEVSWPVQASFPVAADQVFLSRSLSPYP